MKMNRKGDIGFPEAIMASMVVTLVLTAFIGMIAMDMVNSEETVPEERMELAEYISVVEGVAVGDLTEPMTETMERNDYRGITVRCSMPGTLVECNLEFTVGQMDGDLFSDRYLDIVNTDDGRVLCIVFEVAICT